ncbi:OmpA family protein [Spirosoma sp. SC4-14]|uniref:OmpA family protein n=1 Tax=Spirosoma sp. SC4-14 TaxID=3128900 RepID=UPI0030D41C26
MKKRISALFGFMLLPYIADAQVQIENPQRTVERNVEWRANQKVDQGVNRGLDKLEEGIGNIFKKKPKADKNSKQPANNTESETNSSTDSDKTATASAKPATTRTAFDVNSDKIKPESYGTLKDIAAILTDNPTVTVKIIGHTDSEGDEASNLTLSKKRAAAVKASLNKEFGIAETRLQTDGMGESQPVDSNTTPQGKANNRRVEFLKL